MKALKICAARFSLLSILFVLALEGSLKAQVTAGIAPENESISQSYPIPGSHLLWKQEQQVREYVAQHPEMFTQMKLAKPTSWNFTVGSQHAWYAVDFTTSQNYQVQSTCRAVGTNCYIFVEDSLWNTRVNQAAVDSVRVAFDLRTPANPSKGIYQMDVEAFGNPPDVDNDPRIIILILNIKDGWNGTGGYVAGYFYSFNETNQPQSNKAEIYYIDANPVNLSSPSGLEAAMSTTAHEFQHMIHWNYDKYEYTFINEGCSLLAEVNCGYPIYDQSGYVNETNHYLLDWRSGNSTEVLRDYSRAARFMVYVRDQLGIGVFRYIVQDTYVGIGGLNDAFQKYGTTLRFNDIFKNWLVANILDDRSVNPAYGYLYPGLPKAAGKTYFNPNVPSASSTVRKLAAEYLSFKGGSQLKATFTTASSSILVKAVEIGSSAKRVLDVTPNVEFSEPAFGTTYTTIHFVVLNMDQYSDADYSYQASGVGGEVVELKWDETEPAGFLRLSTLDTVCVTFDAVPNAKLDSIRVALRRAGSISGGVWRYTGVQRPTPLGTPLAVPITASISTTPDYPYPVPWPNWATVDLRSYSIDAGAPFAVGFVISRYDSPAVMVTKYPGQNAYHSFTYLHNPGSGSANWYYLTAGTDSIWIYLIRAYVSYIPVGVKEVVELLPSSFDLKQNYPNPFSARGASAFSGSPTTMIRFALPEESQVYLEIYNILGEKVRSLIHGDVYQAGNWGVVWDGKDDHDRPVSSGVYYYRIVAGDYARTMRMILLR